MSVSEADIRSLMMTSREKKYYMMGLLTIAGVDEKVSGKELGIINRAAKVLGAKVRKRDLRGFDIERIAGEIRRTKVRRLLLAQVAEIANADRKLEPSEVKTVKFLAAQWQLPLPKIPGVEWEKVDEPKGEEVEKISDAKREKLESGGGEKALASADHGFQFVWVIGAAVIYIVVAGFLTVLTAIIEAGAGAGADPANGLLLKVGMGFFACLLTGLIVGKLSTGRTIREPAIGVVLPQVAVVGWFIYSVREASGLSDEQMKFLIIGGVVAGLAQYVTTLIGAWIGEALDRD